MSWRRSCVAPSINRRAYSSMNKPARAAFAFALCFLCAVLASALLGELHRIVPIAYALLSFVTFVVYAVDKAAARSGGWRISERNLHLLSLAGGWPGALIAQQRLRHKTQKPSFKTAFWLTVIANGGLLVWLHTDEGKNSLIGLLTGLT
ncbi:MAG: DUF1294 domain-containing protein [Pseudomonadota bacterium]